MKANICSCAAQKVRELRTAESIQIQRDDVVDYIMRNSNIHEIEREELERMVANDRASVILWQHGYYSLKRGSGEYINAEMCEQLYALRQIENNLNEDLFNKLKAIRKIRDLQNGVLSGQIDFDDLGISCG